MRGEVLRAAEGKGEGKRSCEGGGGDGEAGGIGRSSMLGCWLS